MARMWVNGFMMISLNSGVPQKSGYDRDLTPRRFACSRCPGAVGADASSAGHVLNSGRWRGRPYRPVTARLVGRWRQQVPRNFNPCDPRGFERCNGKAFCHAERHERAVLLAIWRQRLIGRTAIHATHGDA
jgi:hypothetical protein